MAAMKTQIFGWLEMNIVAKLLVVLHIFPSPPSNLIETGLKQIRWELIRVQTLTLVWTLATFMHSRLTALSSMLTDMKKNWHELMRISHVCWETPVNSYWLSYSFDHMHGSWTDLWSKSGHSICIQLSCLYHQGLQDEMCPQKLTWRS